MSVLCGDCVVTARTVGLTALCQLLIVLQSSMNAERPVSCRNAIRHMGLARSNACKGRRRVSGLVFNSSTLQFRRYYSQCQSVTAAMPAMAVAQQKRRSVCPGDVSASQGHADPKLISSGSQGGSCDTRRVARWSCSAAVCSTGALLGHTLGMFCVSIVQYLLKIHSVSY